MRLLSACLRLPSLSLSCCRSVVSSLPSPPSHTFSPNPLRVLIPGASPPAFPRLPSLQTTRAGAFLIKFSAASLGFPAVGDLMTQAGRGCAACFFKYLHLTFSLWRHSPLSSIYNTSLSLISCHLSPPLPLRRPFPPCSGLRGCYCEERVTFFYSPPVF